MRKKILAAILGFPQEMAVARAMGWPVLNRGERNVEEQAYDRMVGLDDCRKLQGRLKSCPESSWRATVKQSKGRSGLDIWAPGVVGNAGGIYE